MAHETYPWDEWFDGYIWELKRGIDFLVKPEHMQINIYVASKKRDIRVRSTRIGNVIVLQKFTPDPYLEEFEKEVERIRRRDNCPDGRGRPQLRRR